MRTMRWLFLLLAGSGFARADSYGKLPLTFEANQGQTDARVKFLSRGPGRTFYLTASETVIRSGHEVARIKLIHANASARLAGEEELSGKSHYFVGSDPLKWRTNVPNYGRVHFTSVYPGIDLLYYGSGSDLEYDFVVAPGADPGAIRFTVGGSGKLSVEDSGDLVLGGMRLHRPIVYQRIDGRRQSIEGGFVIHGGQVRFEIARYDRAKPLIIDPLLTLSYSTYLGGNAADQGMGIAVDGSGNAYVTGFTDSSNFPTKNPYQGALPSGGNCAPINCKDAFVTKLNAAGNALVYSTYIGGSNDDRGLGIAVDSAGNAYITGITQSNNFPTTSGAYQTTAGFAGSFVTKLNASGALAYSTYFPATTAAIAVDSFGNAYITGGTNGELPATANAFQTKSHNGDAYVAKLNPAGSALVYCTYLGGSFSDNGTGIAVDPSGNAYVTGNTSSSDFPVKNPYQATLATQTIPDSFVTAFNSTGSALIYSTYLGGSGAEQAASIAVDSAGNAYVTGSTNSPDFPTTPNAFEGPIASGGAYQGYVTKFQPNGNVVYSTYLGTGLGGAYSYGIAANAQGNAYVTGGASATFPTQDPYQAAPGGPAGNAFVSVLNSTGTALAYSTYLGGNNGDAGYAIALDSGGNVYVTGIALSTNFPTLNAFQPKYGGPGTGVDSLYGDAFVAKFSTSGGGSAGPTISANGVVNGASFQPGIVPGSWATIQGGGLSSVTDTWNNFIVNGQLPTTVDGVSVSVGGKPGYVYYVSAGQINFIVPDVPVGTQQVTVHNSAGTSSAATVTVGTFGPAFFPWPNNQVVATRQDFSLAAANGTFPGTTTIPAKPGDTIILWGTGFGPTTPSAPQGVATPGNATYSTANPTVEINNVSATVYGAALAPGFAGLYQVAIEVPTSLGNGNWPVVATIGGVSSPSGMVLTVQQ